jgi:hypothetical protein
MVKPVTADNRDVGTDPTAAPVATPRSAEDIAARQTPIVQKYDPAKGLSMQASAMALNAAKTKEANDKFDQGVNAAAAGGWDSLMEYTNKSGASPEKHRAVPNTEDGGKTVRIMKVMPDGSLIPTGQIYNADTQGVMTAAEMLTRGTPMAAKDREKNDETRANAAETRANGGINRLSENDKLTLQDLNKQGEQINAARLKLEGDPTFDADSPEGQKKLKRFADLERDVAIKKRALAQKADSANADRPVGRGGSADPMGRNSGATGDSRTMDGKARVNLDSPDAERARIYTDELAALPKGPDREAMLREIARLPPATRALVKGLPDAPLPAASPPGAGTPGQPEATPAAVVDPKSGRPMPAPGRSMAAAMGEEESTIDRIGKAVGGMYDRVTETMKQEGAEYNGIEQRVRAAKRGGAPLTPEEMKLARKYGLAV